MPELPEVEAARKAVHESCCGRRIVEANIADDTIVINGVSPSALESSLVGRTILGAYRKGKNIWLELDARPWPSFQFGMTGAFSIKGKAVTKYKRSAVSDEEEWPSKFSKVFLKLDDGLEISFTDKRRLARVRLLDDPVAVPPISELGPDAFIELPVEAAFTSSILKKRGPIKALLLDQSFLAGIGNWVADEVLYQARIHPEQVASSLSEDECVRLHKSIQEVLKLSTDVNADSESFPKDWIFHYRWNKKAGEVGGHKISFITVGGRTSAFVPALQKCTSQSSRNSRKKNDATEVEIEDHGSENDETKVKKKGGRKKQMNEADVPSDDEEVQASQTGKKNKASTKDSLGVKKAGSKKGGRSKTSASEEEKESKSTVSKGKRTGKGDQEYSAGPPKSHNTQGRVAAKKRSGKEESGQGAKTSTLVNTRSKEKVGKRTSAKQAETVEVRKEEEQVEMAKGDVPKMSKKRKRVAK